MGSDRVLSPEFFHSERLAQHEPLARILFAGLWTEADRDGRLEDRPERLKARLLPYDTCDVDLMLQRLHDTGFIVRYVANRKHYVAIRPDSWVKHQRGRGALLYPEEQASGIPPPPKSSEPGDPGFATSCGDGPKAADGEAFGGEGSAPGGGTCKGGEGAVAVQGVLYGDNGQSKGKGSRSGGGIKQPSPPAYSPGFVAFWEAYPNVRKYDKADSWKLWRQQRLEPLAPLVMAGLEAWKRSRQWQKEGGEYICNPAKFLRRRRWQDPPRPAPEWRPPDVRAAQGERSGMAWMFGKEPA